MDLVGGERCWGGRRRLGLMDDERDDEMIIMQAFSWFVGYACGFLGRGRGVGRSCTWVYWDLYRSEIRLKRFSISS